MKSIASNPNKFQKQKEADAIKRIEELKNSLLETETAEEREDLLNFYIEATEEGAIRKWLIEFKNIFGAMAQAEVTANA
jgi:hypothetical protein